MKKANVAINAVENSAARDYCSECYKYDLLDTLTLLEWYCMSIKCTCVGVMTCIEQ